jgi:hypothetical protein
LKPLLKYLDEFRWDFEPIRSSVEFEDFLKKLNYFFHEHNLGKVYFIGDNGVLKEFTVKVDKEDLPKHLFVNDVLGEFECSPVKVRDCFVVDINDFTWDVCPNRLRFILMNRWHYTKVFKYKDFRRIWMFPYIPMKDDIDWFGFNDIKEFIPKEVFEDWF